MAIFTLDQEAYEALIALARRGTLLADGTIDLQRVHALEAFLTDIERKNDIVRYSLWVQWQNPTQPLPAGTNFPQTWPPELRYFIQFISRPISKADVMKVVQQLTPNAINIMVTPDVGAIVGWSEIDKYFVQP